MGMAAMDMAATVSRPKIKHPAFAWLVLLAFPASGYAGDWRFTPSVNVSERFTDNVKLVSTAEESSFITEVAPGFALTKKGSRADVSVNYNLQGLLYSHDSDAGDLHNQLAARARFELVEDRFFLDANASVAQQNTNSITGPTNPGGSNYNLTGNSSETRSLSITPSFVHRFASTAQLDARWQLNYSGSDNGTVSDTNGSNFNLGLKSGAAFQRISWALNHGVQYSDGANSTRTSSTSATAGYAPTAKTRFNLTVGADDNNRGNVGSFKQASGTYWNIGASWSPTSRTKLDATAGHRYSGASYGLNFSHKTRNTNWTLRYSEDISDIYSQLNGTAAFDVYNCSGVPYVIPAGSLPPNPTCVLAPFPIYLPTTSLINDTSLNRTWSGGLSWQLSKSTITANLSRSQREQLATGIEDTNQSLSGAWNWRINSRMTSNLGLAFTQADNGAADSDTYSLTWSLSRKLSAKATGSIELRHYVGDTSASGRYTENSAAARLNLSF